jgi:hypothetical protein
LGKSLLLISTLEEDRAFAAEVAITAGLTLETVATAEEGAQVIAADRAAVVFVDATSETVYQAFERGIQATIGLFSEKISNNYFHFLTDSGPEESHYLLMSPLFGNLIMRNFGLIQEAGPHYGRLVKASIADKIFGLPKLMSPEAKVQIVKLQSTAQKQDAVDAVKNYLIAAQFPGRIATTIANSVDELLMNAMFDAPVDELGKPTFSKLDRATVMKLEGKGAVELHIGYDGTYLGLSVVDQWGSLDKAKLLQHISKLYRNEEYKIRTTTAGAGIGLASVFHAGGSFIFASENRLKTEVTVFYRRTDSFKTFRDQFRFMMTQNYF